jgi:serine/threonine protein kinase
MHDRKWSRCYVGGLVRYIDSAQNEIVSTSSGGTVKRSIDRFLALELMEFSVRDMVEHWKECCKRNFVTLGNPVQFMLTQYVVGSVLRTLRDLSLDNQIVRNFEMAPSPCPVSALTAFDFTSSQVHRDIKPGNIMFDRLYQVRLVDFGLAKELAKESEDTSTISHTEDFAPPETEDKVVHLLSDVYSLGLVLVNMLTCEKPWGKDFASHTKNIEASINNLGPKHKYFCAMDWVSLVVKVNHKERAFFSQTNSHTKSQEVPIY